MGEAPETEVTRVLLDGALDDSARAARLLPMVYEQLRAAARRALDGERSDHTLSATALVHEAFIRLAGDRKIPWANRAHYYAAAAEAMRRVLLDHARARGRKSRGGDRRRVAAGLAEVAAEWNLEETVALDEAIRRLGERWADVGEIVRLRFYAGLSIDDTAAALDLSPRTVKRRWRLGRAWLARELLGDDPDER